MLQDIGNLTAHARTLQSHLLACLFTNCYELKAYAKVVMIIIGRVFLKDRFRRH